MCKRNSLEEPKAEKEQRWAKDVADKRIIMYVYRSVKGNSENVERLHRTQRIRSALSLEGCSPLVP